MTIVKLVRSHKLQNTFNTWPLLHFKLCTLMPEDGQGQRKHVAYSGGSHPYVRNTFLKPSPHQNTMYADCPNTYHT